MKYKIDATVRLNIEADSLSKAKELFKDWRTLYCQKKRSLFLTLYLHEGRSSHWP